LDFLENYIFSKGYDKVFLYSYEFTKSMCEKRGYSLIEEKSFKKGELVTKGYKMAKKLK